MRIKNHILERLANSTALFVLMNSKELPVRVSFQLATFWKNLEKPLQTYLNEKQKLINKYADKNEKNEPIKVGNEFKVQENWAAFKKDFEELLELESEVLGERLIIKIETLPDKPLSPQDIITLKDIFTFE